MFAGLNTDLDPLRQRRVDFNARNDSFTRFT
jgi:hypothetical protein